MQPIQTSRKIEQYVTNVGIFFREQSNHGYRTLDGLLINDVLCSQYTKHSGFFKIDKPISSVKQRVNSTVKQIGWKLINPELACGILPSELNMTQLNYDSEEERYVGEFDDRVSMYEAIFLTTESYYEEVPFELVTLGTLEVSNYNKPEEMKITQQLESFYGNKNLVTQNLSGIVNYEDVVRILTPEFMLHTQPCMLTSKQVYSIVRHYIKENINPKVAQITSDYDFCFTVKKIVKTEPFIVRVEKLTRGNNSYSPRRYENKTNTTVLVDIFEMTYSGYKGNSGYEGYTCIPEWKANSLKEMQEHIKSYLESLMNVINSDLKQCSCCKGTGYSVESAMNVKR